MILEKDGQQVVIEDEIQIKAFMSNGWREKSAPVHVRQKEKEE